MQLEIALSKIDQLKSHAKQIHQLAISNGLNAKASSEIFSKFDSKLTSVSNSIHKMQGYAPGEYEYTTPKANPVMEDKAVSKESLKNQLISFKAKMAIFQENWKNEGYKVVNSKTNEIANINNTNKGNVTKALKDLEDLIDKF